MADSISERLQLERERIERTLARSDRARLTYASGDRRTYEVTYDVRTVLSDSHDRIRIAETTVPVLFDLSPEFPLVAPVVFAAPIGLFNPHVWDPRIADRHPMNPPLPPLSLLCLGSFSPSRCVSDWISAAYELLAFARVALEKPFNLSAAEWAREQLPGVFPTDCRPFSTVRGRHA